eukprot:Filipodium_phascolosomae@DN537_c0_g1_i2.p1
MASHEPQSAATRPMVVLAPLHKQDNDVILMSGDDVQITSDTTKRLRKPLVIRKTTITSESSQTHTTAKQRPDGGQRSKNAATVPLTLAQHTENLIAGSPASSPTSRSHANADDSPGPDCIMASHEPQSAATRPMVVLAPLHKQDNDVILMSGDDVQITSDTTKRLRKPLVIRKTTITSESSQTQTTAKQRPDGGQRSTNAATVPLILDQHTEKNEDNILKWQRPKPSLDSTEASMEEDLAVEDVPEEETQRGSFSGAITLFALVLLISILVRLVTSSQGGFETCKGEAALEVLRPAWRRRLAETRINMSIIALLALIAVAAVKGVRQLVERHLGAM